MVIAYSEYGNTESSYTSNGKVLQWTENYFLVQVNDNIRIEISVDRLKLYVERNRK